MRKSAVSVRSEAGMCAHMAEERISGGGGKMYGKERKGQRDPTHGSLHALHQGRHAANVPPRSFLEFGIFQQQYVD